MADALKILKSVVVVPVTLELLRSELFATRQDSKEPFWTFSIGVHRKAEAYEFRTAFKTTYTSCNTATKWALYYTDEVIWDTLLNGILDSDFAARH